MISLRISHNLYTIICYSKSIEFSRGVSPGAAGLPGTGRGVLDSL